MTAILEKIDRVKVVANHCAGVGRGGRCLKEIERQANILWREKKIKVDIERTHKLEERGIITGREHFYTYRKDGKNDAITIARMAVRDEYDVAVFAGGDGTINEGTNGLCLFGAAAIPLAIIAGGVGDDFVSQLGSPKGVDWFFKLLLREDVNSIRKKIKLIDVGLLEWEENGGIYKRAFNNILSFGLDALINKEVVSWKENKSYLFRIPFSPIFIKGVYFYAALKMLLRNRRLEYPELRIDIDDSEGSFEEITILGIGNGSKYGRFLNLVPQADLQDGMLDICQIGKTRRRRLLVTVLKIVKGTHVSLPEVKKLPDGSLPKTSKVKVFSRRPTICQMDGEVVSLPAGEYRISVLPKALPVIIP